MEDWILSLDQNGHYFHLLVDQPGVYDWQPTTQQQQDMEWYQQTNDTVTHDIVLPLGFNISHYAEFGKWSMMYQFTGKKLSRGSDFNLKTFIESDATDLRQDYEKVYDTPQYYIESDYKDTSKIVWIELCPDTQLRQSADGNIVYADKIMVTDKTRDLSQTQDWIQILQDLMPVLVRDQNILSKLFNQFRRHTLEWQCELAQLALESECGIFATVCSDVSVLQEWLRFIINCNSLRILSGFFGQMPMQIGHQASIDISRGLSAAVDIDVLEYALRHGCYLDNGYLIDVVLIYDADKIQFAESLGLKLDFDKLISIVRHIIWYHDKMKRSTIKAIYHKYRTCWTRSLIVCFVQVALLGRSLSLLAEFMADTDIEYLNEWIQTLMTTKHYPYKNFLSDLMWYSDMDCVKYLLAQGLRLPENSIEWCLSSYARRLDPSWAVAEYLIQDMNYCVSSRKALLRGIARHVEPLYKSLLRANSEWLSWLDDIVGLCLICKNASCLDVIQQQLHCWQMDDILYHEFPSSVKWWHNRLPYKKKFAQYLQSILATQEG